MMFRPQKGKRKDSAGGIRLAILPSVYHPERESAHARASKKLPPHVRLVLPPGKPKGPCPSCL